MKPVIIYTDGAARGNPGRGGYGIVMMYGNKTKEISQGYRHTTNNRMELLAIIVAIESLKMDNLNVEIFTDSAYVVNSIEKKWVWGWLKKGFQGKKNEDLWRRFLALYPKHNIKLNWVKGHASNVYNNRCDELATVAADGKDHLIDHYFENINNNNNNNILL